MTDDERCGKVAAMLTEALLLEREGHPVLATNMARVVAILHETRQLLDPEYRDMRPPPVG